jgi:hypothetical protein
MTHFSIFNPDRWRSAFLDRKIAAPIRDEPDVNTSERQPRWRRTRQPRKPRRRAMTDLTDFVNVMASAEDWLAAGASDRETAAPPGEPMKRFTIDVPVSLHRRIKTACARRGLKTPTVLRDLLEREFPDTSGQFRLPLIQKSLDAAARSVAEHRQLVD